MKRLATTSLMLAGCAALVLAFVPAALAADPVEVPLTVENQKFSPAEVKVKAGAPFRLVVTNKDAKSVEVESKLAKFEKVVPAGKTVKVFVRALKPGTYDLYDDHNKSTKGTIVAE